ncbi:hypothetical protein Tco_0736719 [Tanacetum coccineum]
MQDKEERIRKRYKSSDESSFNTRESGDGIFNLNITTGDEEDERPVQRSKGRENDIVIADQKARAGLKAVELEIRRLENRYTAVERYKYMMTRCAGIETFAIATDLEDGLLPMTDCMPYGGVQSQVVEQPTEWLIEMTDHIQDKGYKGNFDLRLPVAGRGGQLLKVERGIFDVEGMGPDNVPMVDGEDDPKDSSVTLELEVMDVKESYAGWSRKRWKVKFKCKANPLWQQKKLNDICKRNDILLSGYSLGVCGTQ